MERRKSHKASRRLFESVEVRTPLDFINDLERDIDIKISTVRDLLDDAKSGSHLIDLMGENIKEMFPDAYISSSDEGSVTYTLKTPLMWNDDEDAYENGMTEIELDTELQPYLSDRRSQRAVYFRWISAEQVTDKDGNLEAIRIEFDSDACRDYVLSPFDSEK